MRPARRRRGDVPSPAHRQFRQPLDHSDEQVEGDHPDPSERFIRYAGLAHWCQFCCGMARRSAMEKTRLLGTFCSGDRLSYRLAPSAGRAAVDTITKPSAHSGTA